MPEVISSTGICTAIISLIILVIPNIYGQVNETAYSNCTASTNQNDDEFWKADMGDLISSLAACIAAGGLVFTGLTFRKQIIASQIQMVENLIKDIKNLEAEYNDLDPAQNKDKLKNLQIRLLNTVEWFAFLANRNKRNSKDAICFIKPIIIVAYNFLDDNTRKKYPELEKLHQNIKD